MILKHRLHTYAKWWILHMMIIRSPAFQYVTCDRLITTLNTCNLEKSFTIHDQHFSGLRGGEDHKPDIAGHGVANLLQVEMMRPTDAGDALTLTSTRLRPIAMASRGAKR